MSNHAHFLFRSVDVAYHSCERLVYIFSDCYIDHRDIKKVLDMITRKSGRKNRPQERLGKDAQFSLRKSRFPLESELMNQNTSLNITKLWHSLEIEKVFSEAKSGTGGLTTEEALNRLSQFGPNKLSPPKKRGPITRFIMQFHSVLIYVLLGAGIVTALLSQWVDAGVIIGVVFINAVIGFIQEGKAESALEAIRNMLSQQATVLRDGKRITLPADKLVPGDIVFLQSGDKVPADVRLIKMKELRIDEAALTGESMPVEKTGLPVNEKATVGDRKCMAYSGTLVTFGQGMGVVVETGDRTEIGRINMLLKKVRPLTTRLLSQISEFGQMLTMTILGIAAATFAFGVFVRKYEMSEMFLAVVGLAVAAIPEGLPAIITITLAIGVQRMARRNAIIRRLPAVETLGSVTVICSDKTGTLTRNEMTAQTVASSNFFFEVKGAGYDPHGGFSLDGKDAPVSDYPILTEIARAGLLCNDSQLQEVEGRWEIQGDPTEGALISLARKAGLDPSYENEQFPRTDVIPFESEHRFMATLHHDHAGHGFIYVKGAPELIFEMCSTQRSYGEDRPIDSSYWHEQMEQIAISGQRLLAVAFKPADSGQRELNFSHVQDGFTFLGLFGIIDPPRTEAVEAVKICAAAGIRVKMVTGDHAVTARSIGARMGIGDGISVVNGAEVDDLNDEQLRIRVQNTDVFARVSPENKLRLVQALQANGEVVAMTGDGVNDAPALKRADVGVSMGIKGTEVAKEASEMVLADDNFASIAHAVEQGRTVYDNIKKSIMFILPTNGGEAGIIIAAILSGRMLPITPVQILWINMITAVTLALSLSFEPAEKRVMKRLPRNPREQLLSFFLVWRILFVSSILVMGTFGLFLWNRIHDVPIEVARTAAVNTLVMFEVFYLFNTRFLKEAVLNREGLLGNRFVHIAIVLVIAAQFLFTYTKPFQLLFSSAALTMADWLRIIVVAFSVFVLVETEKFFLRRRERQKKLMDKIWFFAI
jgi:magnesium-transporting ATPase (P-type)